MNLAFNPSCNVTSRFPKNDSYERRWCEVVSYRKPKKEEMVIGDVKDGFQVSDHDGWIKLDGRLRSSLKTTQRVKAIDLGIGVNIPDASNSFSVQNGQALGSLVGSNTRTIQQGDLPNVSLPGVVSTSGDHTHTGSTSANGNHNHTPASAPVFSVYGAGGVAGWAAGGSFGNFHPGGSGTTSVNGNHAHTLNIGNGGAHTHTTTTELNGGVSQAMFNITPLGLSVNKFVYLGL